MRVIAHRTLVLFYNNHSKAKIALEEWFIKTINADWASFADIKKTFNSVDAIGNQHYVFNIHGNDYRLIAVVKFKIKMVFVRFVGTHSEHDKMKDHSNI